MDDVMRWQERNGRHLSAALARLRRLLGQASPMDDHAPGGGDEVPGDEG